jgi:hypothetical protein
MRIRINILKLAAVIPITIIHHGSFLWNRNISNQSVVEEFVQNLFSGSLEREADNLFLVIIGLFEITIFNFLFATFIYKDIHISGIYIFTRQKNRLHWFGNKAFELLFYALTFVTLYLVTILLLSTWTTKQSINFIAMEILFTSIILLTLFTFFSTLLINILALHFGSSIAFIGVYMCLTILTGAAIVNDNITFLNKHPIFLKLNPMANILINWGITGSDTIFSIVYYVILTTLLMMTGMVYISHIDIGLIDKENM